MLDNLVSFILKYKGIISFYLIIIILLVIKRKALDFQAKIIVLYRTKFGLKFIEKFTQRFREWIILYGYIGMGAGYVGLIFISYYLIKSAYDLLTVPSATSGVSLVLPGLNIPGVGILPFWHWLLAIFVIAVVHEFSHGIVARAHGIQVKNTGVVLFGPIIGAFVEPDEKKLSKQKDVVQYSTFAAGPFSNVILAIIAVLLLTLIFLPLQKGMETSTGVTFESYYNSTVPVAKAGLLPGMVITGIDEAKITDTQQFNEALYCQAPGSNLTLSTSNHSFTLALSDSPYNPQQGFLGMMTIREETVAKEDYRQSWGKIAYAVVCWMTAFLNWLWILSLGIGIFNLLPLPLVDGGRMLQVTLQRLKGKEKGDRRYKQIGLFFLLVLLVILLFSVYSTIGGWLGF